MTSRLPGSDPVTLKMWLGRNPSAGHQVREWTASAWAQSSRASLHVDCAWGIKESLSPVFGRRTSRAATWLISQAAQLVQGFDRMEGGGFDGRQQAGDEADGFEQ